MIAINFEWHFRAFHFVWEIFHFASKWFLKRSISISILLIMAIYSYSIEIKSQKYLNIFMNGFMNLTFIFSFSFLSLENLFLSFFLFISNFFQFKHSLLFLIPTILKLRQREWKKMNENFLSYLSGIVNIKQFQYSALRA